MLKHNGAKGSRARKPISEQQAASKTDGDDLPMKWSAVIGKKYGMHRSEESRVDEAASELAPFNAAAYRSKNSTR
jgi:hypothetical protein